MLKIERTHDIKIVSETTARSALKKSEQEESTFSDLFGMRMPTIDTEIEPFDLDILEHETYYQVRKVKLRIQKDVLSIAQQGIEETVFNQNVIILLEGSEKVSGKITIRSDDFTDGVYNETFSIDLK